MIFLPTTGAFTRLKGTFLETSQDSQNNHFSILEVGETCITDLPGLFWWVYLHSGLDSNVLRPKLEVFHKLGWIKDYQTRSLHVPSLKLTYPLKMDGWKLED